MTDKPTNGADNDDSADDWDRDFPDPPVTPEREYRDDMLRQLNENDGLENEQPYQAQQSEKPVFDPMKAVMANVDSEEPRDTEPVSKESELLESAHSEPVPEDEQEITPLPQRDPGAHPEIIEAGATESTEDSREVAGWFDAPEPAENPNATAVGPTGEPTLPPDVRAQMREAEREDAEARREAYIEEHGARLSEVDPMAELEGGRHRRRTDQEHPFTERLVEPGPMTDPALEGRNPADPYTDPDSPMRYLDDDVAAEVDRLDRMEGTADPFTDPPDGQTEGS